MSHIGKKIIDIPTTVTVELKNKKISVKGAHGTLERPLFDLLVINIENNKLLVSRINETKRAKSVHGLMRTLIQNMITGVTQPFTINLLAEGVGYKFQLDNTFLNIFVGFTNSIKILIPKEITVFLLSPTKVSLCSIDKEKVGLLASKIYNVKPPEPYKGKGILYEGEIIKRKVGKKGK
jgi:large subunit ribosomal protein L6